MYQAKEYWLLADSREKIDRFSERGVASMDKQAFYVSGVAEGAKYRGGRDDAIDLARCFVGIYEDSMGKKLTRREEVDAVCSYAAGFVDGAEGSVPPPESVPMVWKEDSNGNIIGVLVQGMVR